MLRRCLTTSAVLLSLVSVAVYADDWPQWMGPHRDGLWQETGVIDSIPDSGLTVKWRTPVGLGYAGPAVAGHRVFVLDYQLTDGKVAANPGTSDKLAGRERLVCLNADTGEILWEHGYDQPYSISYGSGPRTTPTVDGDHVYALGAEGRLSCVAADGGKLVWEHDLKQEYGAATPYWGHSAHPLVHGNLLISLVGGDDSGVVAFEKQTGKEVWRALSGKEIGYCPPTMATGTKTPQLLIWLPSEIHGLNPETGAVLWSVPLKPDFGMSIAAPAQQGRFAFVAGVRNQSVLLELADDAAKPKELWRGTGSTSVSTSHTGILIVDNTIFGCDDKGWLRAVDLPTGDRLWETLAATKLERPANYGTVFEVKNGDRWFLFADNGDLAVAEIDRNGYHEHGRFHVLEPTADAFGRAVVWSHPAFAQRCLFARNDKEIVCVSLESK
ncbi:MAG: PQQ-binding-like beta-propeller repeat protein [Planctomycetaceae bacterium]